MILLHYKANTYRTRGCHCHPEYERFDSDFAIVSVNDEAEAIEYITKARIANEPEAEELFIIYRNWESVLRSVISSRSFGGLTINVPDDGTDIFLFDMQERIETAVKSKVTAHREKEAEHEKMQEAAEKERKRLVQEERDRQELQRLKAKYE